MRTVVAKPNITLSDCVGALNRYSTPPPPTGGDNTLVSAKLYSADELARWQYRAVNGPFKTDGDAYTNSVGEYEDIKNSAQYILTRANSEYVLPGTCQTIDPDDSSTWYDWYQYGKFEEVMNASFVDLVEGTNVYTARIKELLLLQAQEPCMDFTNHNLYPYGSRESTWQYAAWLRKVLKAYDYLDPSVFTTSEKTIIDNWFKGAADWFNYMATTKYFDHLYSTRDHVDVVNSVANYDPNTILNYKGGQDFKAIGYNFNNRILGITNFVTQVGVKYNNATWKETGAQLTREFVSLFFDENGYYAELNRSGTDHAESGLAYGSDSLLNVAEISHLLYNDGYVNLFEYKSYATIDFVNGGIKAGSVEKSLEWAFLKFRENFLLPSSPNIYPVGNTNEVPEQVIHFCKNPTSSSIAYSGHILAPAYIVNRYYNNSLIAEIYDTPKGNICGFNVSTLHLKDGPFGTSPGYFFQYGSV